MTNDLANIIKDYFKDEVWVDRIAGMVRTVTVKKKGLEGKFFYQNYPVSCDVQGLDCMEEGNLNHLIPDSNRRSIFYFEDQGSRFISLDTKGTRWEAIIRLIGWLNLKKFETTSCNLSSLIVQNIISLVGEPLINSAPYIQIRITPHSMPAKSSAIFSRYSYKEWEQQHLIDPFDYFALDWKVEFTINTNCINDIVIADNPC